MRFGVLAAIIFFSTTAAQADDKSVDYAYALCKMIDNTGLTSKPCDVSGWGSSVTATIDMTSSEARDLCGKISNAVHQQGAVFRPGWTLQIKSPYSGDNSIAFCNL